MSVPFTPDGIRKIASGAAAVNPRLIWLPVAVFPPPRGLKLQLINRPSGVATYSIFRATDGWTHWQGLPVFDDEPDAPIP